MDVGGLAGLASDVIAALGEWGIGLLTLVETVFPPIPSEVILPFAGYLTIAGNLSLPLVIATSTLGAWLGALILYHLGAALGLERSIRLLSRLPLVHREDFEKGARWFARHGRSAIFFGRLIPGVRSVISLPAGAQRMNVFSFSLFTIAGSGLWNSCLVALGAALGTQYELVERYSVYLNYVLYAALAAVVAWLIVREVRRRD